LLTLVTRHCLRVLGEIPPIPADVFGIGHRLDFTSQDQYFLQGLGENSEAPIDLSYPLSRRKTNGRHLGIAGQPLGIRLGHSYGWLLGFIPAARERRILRGNRGTTPG
jgi:hypothetical protein